MANPAAAARPMLRQLHIYLSVFIAPCLIFFAITGAFQTFRIPDEKTAPVLLQKLARVHRDDVFALKPAPPPKAASADAPKSAPKAKPKPALATTLVKWFFVLTSTVIVVTTLMGVWMGLAYSRNKTILWLLLLAGAAVPASLLAL
jgi:hypothetical protein